MHGIKIICLQLKYYVSLGIRHNRIRLRLNEQQYHSYLGLGLSDYFLLDKNFASSLGLQLHLDRGKYFFGTMVIGNVRISKLSIGHIRLTHGNLTRNN